MPVDRSPDMRHTPPVVAVCETCRREFYRSPGKFCDVPTCRGWVRHILRMGRFR